MFRKNKHRNKKSREKVKRIKQNELIEEIIKKQSIPLISNLTFKINEYRNQSKTK